MKKLLVLAMAALAIFAFVGGSAGRAYADGETVTVQLGAQNGSGQSGTATLMAVGDQTKVMVDISGGTSEPQPAHIHKGTCATLDPKPAYPLSNIVNGKSETMVDEKLSDLATGGAYAINIHKSAAEVSVYVSCGNIEAMMMSGGMTEGNKSMPVTGGGEQNVVLAALAILAVGIMGAGFAVSRRKA